MLTDRDADRFEPELAKLRAANPYVVRHLGCTTVRVLPTRQAAQAYADQVPPPLRHRLRVAKSTRDDVVAALRQQQCRHVTR